MGGKTGPKKQPLKQKAQKAVNAVNEKVQMNIKKKNKASLRGRDALDEITR